MKSLLFLVIIFTAFYIGKSTLHIVEGEGCFIAIERPKLMIGYLFTLAVWEEINRIIKQNKKNREETL